MIAPMLKGIFDIGVRFLHNHPDIRFLYQRCNFSALKKHGAPLTFSPAAFSTLKAHFKDTGLGPQDYDLIVTGDLGSLGSRILIDLFHRDGLPFGANYRDCGVMIYDAARQDVHAGGSGCGCGASVLCGYLLRQLHARKLGSLLFCATGALMSPVSTWQGESIPAICHAVSICNERR